MRTFTLLALLGVASAIQTEANSAAYNMLLAAQGDGTTTDGTGTNGTTTDGTTTDGTTTDGTATDGTGTNDIGTDATTTDGTTTDGTTDGTDGTTTDGTGTDGTGTGGDDINLTPVYPDLTNPDEWYDTDDWEIGQYTTHGSDDLASVVATVDMMYGNNDGVTSWGEMDSAMQISGYFIETELDEDYPDDYDWLNDAELLSHTMTALFSGSNGELNEAEAKQLLVMFGKTEAEAQTYWSENAILTADHIKLQATTMITNSDVEQFHSVATPLKGILLAKDVNGDDIVTLTEFINDVNAKRKAHGHNEVDLQKYINMYGVDYDWTYDLSLVATIMSDGYAITTYVGAYSMCLSEGFPFIVDTYFGATTDKGRHGITLTQLEGFLEHVWTDETGAWMINTIDPWLPYPRPQPYWTTDVFETWFNDMAQTADTDGDGHISFREVLGAMASDLKPGQTLDIDGLVQKYSEGYKWWDIPGLQVFAEIYASKFSDSGVGVIPTSGLTYKQLYDMSFEMTTKQRAWVIDEFDSQAWAGKGMSNAEIIDFFKHWVYADDETDWHIAEPADWVPYAARIDPLDPYLTTEEEDQKYFEDHTHAVMMSLDGMIIQSDTGMANVTWPANLDSMFAELKALQGRIDAKY